MLSEEELLQKRTRSQKKRIDEKSDERGKSRWLVLILLLATSGLALVFYFISSLPQFWQKLTAPAIIRPTVEGEIISSIPLVSPTPELWHISLKNNLQDYLNEESGHYAVYVFDLSKENYLGINEEEVFPAASLIKLPIVFALYHEAERGNINLGEKYSLKKSDKLEGDFGAVNAQPEETIYSYRGLAELALNQSDNIAAGILMRLLGRDKITEGIKNLGMMKTDITQGETTAKEIGTFFRKIAQEEILTAAHRQEIIKYLTDTVFEEQLPSVLPRPVKIAHKVGIDTNILHDGGIIYSHSPFVLVVLSEGPREEAQQVLTKVAAMVWQELGD